MANRRGNGENSIYQHNGRWFVQGYIHGRRTKVSRVKRADAVAAWDTKVKAAAPGRTSDGPRTVSQAAEEWFSLREGDWKYSTRVNYRTALDKQVLPHLGTIRVEGLTPRRVEQWQDDLRRSGLSASTVRQARIVLSGVYTMLLRHERVNSNPVKAVPAPKKKDPDADHLSVEESRAVIAAAASAQARARVLLALTLGLRQGEVLGLRWSDIALGDMPRLTVNGSLGRQTGKGLVLDTAKTRKSRRTLPLSSVHVEVLKAHRAEQNEFRLASGGDFNLGEFVFTTGKGTPVDSANDRKEWLRLLERAGVRVMRVHSQRHTAATLMLGAGSGLQQVQQTLGHTSIRTTVDIYGHLTAEASAPITDAITRALTA